ncbi:MAG: response regulator transcription factor [Acidobacteria bacterium]|nr:response regulator transcription factor [Acidobacteriota bacterium]
MTKIRVVIVDDESPARRKIQRFLSSETDFEVVAQASTGIEAVNIIRQEKPDVLFLDVQMPGLNGFEVVEALDFQPLPQIVFTTAFDQFALRAFEIHALDYLLKPFEQARFESVLEHAKQRLQQSKSDELTEKMNRLLEELRGRSTYAERLLVNSGNRAILLPVSQIDWVEAAKNYVKLHVGKEDYLMRGTIEGLYQKLNPSQFLRVNRSHIVNLESIKELQPWFHGEYKIILKGGKEISWSRRFMDKNSAAILKRI